MLEAARQVRASGVDVVVGHVEAHGRPDTQRLLEGLEQLPCRESAAHAVRRGESSIWTRHSKGSPALLLIDELAHSNALDARACTATCKAVAGHP